jgi:hypothetical protein
MLDEIYGERLTNNPPYTLDSSLLASSLEMDHDENAAMDSAVSVGSTFCIVEQNESDEHCNKPTRDRTAKRKCHSPIRAAGSKALSNLMKMRLEIHQEDVQFNREKWDHERLIKESTVQLEKEKLEFEQKLKEKQYDLEVQKQKDQFELEKYRIDQEMRLRLEIAMLQSNAKCNDE